MTDSPKEIFMRIPSDSDYLELIRNFVVQLMRKVGFNDDQTDQIELAVDEACANVVKYAYIESEKDSTLELKIFIDRDKVTICILDKGKGFSIDAINDPNMETYLAEYHSGGLGIYMMKTLMDEVTYDVLPGVKTEVKMVKYFGQ